MCIQYSTFDVCENASNLNTKIQKFRVFISFFFFFPHSP